MPVPIVYIHRCDVLPETLEPNTIYCVKRNDDLFDVHFTNEDASAVRNLITKEEIISIISQMTIGSSVYKGLWNAATNVPTITSGIGVKGDFYRVSVNGSTLIDGINTWVVNDVIIFDGVQWDKVEAGSAPVYSVAGKTGDVLLDKTDVDLSNVDNVKQLPHNQTLALTGDVTAPSTAINTGTVALTLSPSGVLAGTYGDPFLNVIPIITTDGKGRVTLANALPNTSLPNNATITGIRQSVQTGITAAGTTQNTATSVSADFVVIATGTNNQGVILNPMKPGQTKIIINKTGASIKIYPNIDSGGTFVALSQTARLWRGLSTLGNDVYACVYGGDIYKQTNGTGNFIALNQSAVNWSGMTTLGNDVYACVNGGDIYKQTNGTGNFVALNQTTRDWSGMTTLGNDVYACVYGGDIYKQTNGTGSFVALNQSAVNWSGMTTLGNDVYACVNGGDIYKQTNRTGDFVALGQTSRAWTSMCVLGNDIYACVTGDTIYKQTNATGNFISLNAGIRAWYKMAPYKNDVYACVNGGDIYKLTIGQTIDALSVNTPYVLLPDLEVNVRCVSTNQLYSGVQSNISVTVAEW